MPYKLVAKTRYNSTPPVGTIGEEIIGWRVWWKNPASPDQNSGKQYDYEYDATLAHDAFAALGWMTVLEPVWGWMVEPPKTVKVAATPQRVTRYFVTWRTCNGLVSGEQDFWSWEEAEDFRSTLGCVRGFTDIKVTSAYACCDFC